MGTVLGHIFEALSIDAHFADFKCLGSTYHNTPDVILKTSQNELMVIGELKSPWITEHKIGSAYLDEALLRTLLAQPLDYMQDLDCMYGFLSTYVETMFIRMVEVNGEWEVHYSPVIDAATSYIESASTQGLPSVSLRQCFLHVANEASREGPVCNNTPKSQWVVRTRRSLY